MPRIIVMADNTSDDARAVMFTERVNASDFESPHFQNQLVERLGWAVGDAHRAESAPHEPRTPRLTSCRRKPRTPHTDPRERLPEQRRDTIRV